MMKKLQIVRVDSSNSVQKADLQIGSNVVGIGIVTGCKDERIPKHAVTINVAPDGEMTITPVVTCYMKSPGSSGWMKLDIDSAVPIRTGDLFSLLGEKYWFKLISTDIDMEEADTSLKRKAEDVGNEGADGKKIRTDDDVDTILPPNGNFNDVPSSIGVDPGQEEANNPLDYCEETAATFDAPSTSETKAATLDSNAEQPDCSCPATSSTTDVKSSNVELVKSDVTEASKSSPIDVAPLLPEDKTQGEEDGIVGAEDGGKKIKWDCGRHFSDQSDQSISEAPQNSTSPEPVLSVSNNSPSPLPAVIAPPPHRNRCTYGSKCYRKNQEHREQFSHPGDPDYDVPDDRPECRFGIRCYRKNPQHRRDFKHTVQRRRRPQTPIREKTPETTSGTDRSSLEESIDESEYEPSGYTDSSDEAKSDSDYK